RLARAVEPAQAVLDVGGVARLAEFAVVDDVDAGRDLLLHGLRHRRPDASAEGRGVHGHALFSREHGSDEIVRPRETTGVRRQKALGAASHRPLSYHARSALSRSATATCRWPRARCRMAPPAPERGKGGTVMPLSARPPFRA